MQDSNSFAILSPGEIQAGMFVTVFQTVGMVRPRPTQNMFGMVQEPENNQPIYELNQYPWLKGLPMEVLHVTLPMVMVRNYTSVSARSPLAPVVFMDTRHIHFLEISKEYAEIYIKAEQEARKQKVVINYNPSVFSVPLPSGQSNVSE